MWLGQSLYGAGFRRYWTGRMSKEDLSDGVKKDMKSFGLSWEEVQYLWRRKIKGTACKAMIMWKILIEAV